MCTFDLAIDAGGGLPSLVDAGIKPAGPTEVLWAGLARMGAAGPRHRSAAADGLVRGDRRQPSGDPTAGGSLSMRSRGVGAALALILAVPFAAGCQPTAPASVRVEIVIHYSHFAPSEITVPHGVPVRFVLDQPGPDRARMADR